jgi:hypothetical protein
MSAPPSTVKICFDAGDSDPEEVAQLGQRLRREIQQLDVDSVDFARGGEAPAGAKGDPVTMAALAVTLAPVVLKSLFDLLQGWTSRHDKSTVTIEMGSDKLTLTGSPSKEQLQVIQAALQRHQQG